MEPKDQWQNGLLQRAQTSLGWSLGLKHLQVWKTVTSHFEFGMVKTAIFGTSLKLMAILLASVRFGAVKGRTLRVF